MLVSLTTALALLIMASIFTWLASFWRQGGRSQPSRASSSSSAAAAAATTTTTCPNKTEFFGSQIGGRSVVNYSYTDMPWTLMGWDIVYFFKYLVYFPYVVWPLIPCDSAELSELSYTWGNLFSLFMHAILLVLQLAFVFGLIPFVIFLPVWAAVLVIALFLVVNHGLCLILNGGSEVEHHSQPEYAEPHPDYAHEQWIYINGICAGQHWLQGNLNRLAATFKRPILGIHNKTAGLLFDVLEVLVQRNWGYATKDIRVCYRIIKEKLYDPDLTRVIFILHSQGAVEGCMLIDWLLQEIPQDILAKLEIYTFGNASNHFNNPYRHASSQGAAERNPMAAGTDNTLQGEGGDEEDEEEEQAASYVNREMNGYGETSRLLNGRSNGEPYVPPRRSLTSSTTSRYPSSISDRAIGHIEHYAFTTDFVARWGVLHFATAEMASNTMPRFTGRLFCRTSPRGGHQFVQHYLDGMFPLERDIQTGELARDQNGRLKGCAERNEFMESEVIVAGCGEEDYADEVYNVKGRTWRHRYEQGEGVRMRVKELSRLWGYRNGGFPESRR